MMNSNITPGNINEYGRFDDLKNTIDKEKAKLYFENRGRFIVSVQGKY